MFRYSYDSLVYFGEPVEQSISRLARFGYDAIELIGEPAKYDTKEVSVGIVKEVGLSNGGVMGDTFHMNIEEQDIADAYRQAGKYLKHVHLADSDRAAPGQGHIDFLPILRALKEMNYTGYVAFELLPASGDPFGALEKGEGKEFFDQYTEQATRTIKKLESQLS